MKAKSTLLAAVAGLAALAAAPAFADNGWHAGRGERNAHHFRHAPRAAVIVPPRRIVYAPAPRLSYVVPPRFVYAPPARVVYAPPPAVIYAPAPRVAYPQPAISIRFRLPL
jgi:hypothetical protein